MLRIYKGTVVIADGLPYSAPVEEGLEINGTREVQEDALIRGLELLFFDRLTVAHEFTFTVRQQVSGAVRAVHRAIMLRQELSGVGALTIEIETAGGVLHRWRAARAKWAVTAGKPLGASVALRYAVKAGRFTYSSSSDEDWVGDEIDGGVEGSGEAYDDDVDGGSFLEGALAGDDGEVDGGVES